MGDSLFRPETWVARSILPARNRRELEDIPQSIRALLQGVWAENVNQALAVAFGERDACRCLRS